MTVYLYLFNTLADWESGYLTAEFFSQCYFADKSSSCELIKVADMQEAVTTMGGMKIVQKIDTARYSELRNISSRIYQKISLDDIQLPKILRMFPGFAHN